MIGVGAATSIYYLAQSSISFSTQVQTGLCLFVGGKIAGYIADKKIGELGGTKREFCILFLENFALGAYITSAGWMNPIFGEILRPAANWIFCACLVSYTIWNLKIFIVDWFFEILPSNTIRNLVGPCDTTYCQYIRNPSFDHPMFRMNILDRAMWGERVLHVKTKTSDIPFALAIFEMAFAYQVTFMFKESVTRFKDVCNSFLKTNQER